MLETGRHNTGHMFLDEPGLATPRVAGLLFKEFQSRLHRLRLRLGDRLTGFHAGDGPGHRYRFRCGEGAVPTCTVVLSRTLHQVVAIGVPALQGIPVKKCVE